MMMVSAGDNVTIRMTLIDKLSSTLKTMATNFSKLEKALDNSTKSMSDDMSQASKKIDQSSKSMSDKLRESFDRIQKKSKETTERIKADIAQQQAAFNKLKSLHSGRSFYTASSYGIGNTKSIENMVKAHSKHNLQLSEQLDLMRGMNTAGSVLARNQKKRLDDSIRSYKELNKQCDTFKAYQIDSSKRYKVNRVGVQEPLIERSRSYGLLDHFRAGAKGMHSGVSSGSLIEGYVPSHSYRKQAKQDAVFSAGMVAATTTYALARFTKGLLDADAALQEVFRQAEWGGNNTFRREFAARSAGIMGAYGLTGDQVNDIATSVLKAGLIDEKAPKSKQMDTLIEVTKKIAFSSTVLQSDPGKLVDMASQVAISFANSPIYKRNADGTMTKTGKVYDIEGAMSAFLYGTRDKNGKVIESSAIDLMNYIDKLAKGKTDIKKMSDVIVKGTQSFASMNITPQQMVAMTGYLSQFQPHAGIEEKTFRALSLIMSKNDKDLTPKKWGKTVGELRKAKGNENFSLTTLQQLKDSQGGMTAIKYLFKAYANKYRNKDGTINQGALASSLKLMEGEYGSRIASLMLGLKTDSKGNFVRDKKGNYVSDAKEAGNFLGFIQKSEDYANSDKAYKDSLLEFEKATMSMSTQFKMIQGHIMGIASTLAATLDPIMAPTLKSINSALSVIPGFIQKNPALSASALGMVFFVAITFAMNTLKGYLAKAGQWLPFNLDNVELRLKTIAEHVKTGVGHLKKTSPTADGLGSSKPVRSVRSALGSFGSAAAYGVGFGYDLFKTIAAPMLLGSVASNMLAPSASGYVNPLTMGMYTKFGGKVEKTNDGALTEDTLANINSFAYTAGVAISVISTSLLPKIFTLLEGLALKIGGAVWNNLGGSFGTIRGKMIEMIVAIKSNSIFGGIADFFNPNGKDKGKGKTGRISQALGKVGGLVSQGFNWVKNLALFAVLGNHFRVMGSSIRGIIAAIQVFASLSTNAVGWILLITGAIAGLFALPGLMAIFGYKPEKDLQGNVIKGEQDEKILAAREKMRIIGEKLTENFNNLSETIAGWWNTSLLPGAVNEMSGMLWELGYRLGPINDQLLKFSLDGINWSLNMTIGTIDNFRRALEFFGIMTPKESVSGAPTKRIAYKQLNPVEKYEQDKVQHEVNVLFSGLPAGVSLSSETKKGTDAIKLKVGKNNSSKKAG